MRLQSSRLPTPDLERAFETAQEAHEKAASVNLRSEYVGQNMELNFKGDVHSTQYPESEEWGMGNTPNGDEEHILNLLNFYINRSDSF